MKRLVGIILGIAIGSILFHGTTYAATMASQTTYNAGQGCVYAGSGASNSMTRVTFDADTVITSYKVYAWYISGTHGTIDATIFTTGGGNQGTKIATSTNTITTSLIGTTEATATLVTFNFNSVALTNGIEYNFGVDNSLEDGAPLIGFQIQNVLGNAVYTPGLGYTANSMFGCGAAHWSSSAKISRFELSGSPADPSTISIFRPIHEGITIDFPTWGVNLLSDHADAYMCVLYDNVQDLNINVGTAYRDCELIGEVPGISTTIVKNTVFNTSPSGWEAIAYLTATAPGGGPDFTAVYTFSNFVQFSVTPYPGAVVNPLIPTEPELNPETPGTFWFIDCTGYGDYVVDTWTGIPFFAGNIGAHLWCDIQKNTRIIVYNLAFPHEWSKNALSNSIIYLQYGFPFNIVSGVRDAIVTAANESISPVPLQGEILGSTITFLTPTLLEDTFGADTKNSIFQIMTDAAWVGAGYIMWISLF